MAESITVEDAPSPIKGGAADATPVLDVPIIDLTSCLSSESPRKRKELEKLRSALASCGCVQLMNHGITSSFLDKVHEVGKQFFALPMEEKVKYSSNEYKGYVADSISDPLDSHADRMFIDVFPEDRRDFDIWPQNPQSFREILDEYAANIKSLAENVLKVMAVSLKLEEKSFLEQYGEKASILSVFNFYPPCPTPSCLNLGVSPHTDASVITILLQDNQVEGLQVLKDDQWFRVSTIPHALLMNIGDQVQVMSNGEFKSPKHKVIKNSERERMTIAMFCMPEENKEIGPIEELISEKKPRLYKSMANLILKANEHGKTPIEEAKL